MPSRGQSLTVQYIAWDTDANAGKTGDVANHTLRWVKDGTSAAPAATPTEVDATNAPGVYKVLLSAAECTCNVGTLCGKSSTANVSIMPVTVTFEATSIGLTDAALQDIALIRERVNGVVYYVATGGDDANSGLTVDQAKLTPKTVIEAASAGDIVVLLPGTFALGDTVINIPDGVSVKGAGIDVTTITSTAGKGTRGCIVRPGGNAVLEDLTVTGLAAEGGTAQYAVGVYSAASDGQQEFANAIVRRVKTWANTGGFWCAPTSTASWVLEDSIGYSGVDGYGHTKGTVIARRCLFIGDGTVGTSHNGILASPLGTITLIDCELYANGASNANYSILCFSMTVRAWNCRMSSNGTGAQDLYNSGGTLVVIGCQYDRSKTTGTITDVARVVTDTNGGVTMTDWEDDGRLDLILDALVVAVDLKPSVAQLNARTRLTAEYATAEAVGALPQDKTGYALTEASQTASKADVSGLSTLTAAQVNAQVLDVLNVDTLVAGVSIAESLRRIGALTSGIVTGAGTGTETFKDYAASAKTVVITVDGSGNRSAITYN